MKQPIQRYNQGFGGFGPLEKCKDGKLVKNEYHESALLEKEDAIIGFRYRMLSMENERNVQLSDCCDFIVTQNQNISALERKLKIYKEAFYVSAFLATLFWSILLFLK